MDQADKDMQASLDACLLGMAHDLWTVGSVTEDRYREVLAEIIERRRQRLDPPETRRTPIPFSPDFVDECARQAKAVAANDPCGKEVDAFIAATHEWPED